MRTQIYNIDGVEVEFTQTEKGIIIHDVLDRFRDCDRINTEFPGFPETEEEASFVLDHCDFIEHEDDDYWSGHDPEV